jgi:hypothetical protein
VLTVTPEANEVIEALIARSNLPIDASLRIAPPDNGQSGLTVAITTPLPGDQRVDTSAPIVVSSAAAPLLEAMVLDIEVDDSGRAQFILTHR